MPFPLAHGFAESREAKAYAAGLTARACQRVLAHRLVCVPPLLGRHVLFGVPVFTISVKLLVRFWLVGGLVEGQKIIRQKSSEKVLVGELLSFSTVF